MVWNKNLKVSATKIFSFEMAHKLDSSYYKDCQNIHGHSYKMEITVENGCNADGMVMDFKMLKEIVNPIVEKFDHAYITSNDFGMNPTAENMAVHIFEEIRSKTHLITKVKLWETASCFVEVSY